LLPQFYPRGGNCFSSPIGRAAYAHNSNIVMTGLLAYINYLMVSMRCKVKHFSIKIGFGALITVLSVILSFKSLDSVFDQRTINLLNLILAIVLFLYSGITWINHYDEIERRYQ
jgi:hypothetical protein